MINTYEIQDDKLIVSDGVVDIDINIDTVKTTLNIFKPIKSIKEFTKTGNQLGSNPGGFYKDENGKEFYLKFYDNPEIATSEFKANKIYEALGVNVPKLSMVSDDFKLGIASEVIPDLKIDGEELKTNPVLRPEIMENFAVDAWLSLLDVVGMTYDNLLIHGDTVVRIDVGGSMKYRAQGGLKVGFDCEVTELDSMRDPNRSAGRVFSTITNEEIKIGAKKVLSLTDEKIADIVGDDQDLIDLLICRKEYIRQYIEGM